MPRMKILNAVEQETFETPPVFNSAQRKRYFDFSMETRRQAVKLRTPTNRLCFLLNCGYFKASKRFFAIGLSHQPDIKYVARHTGTDLEMVNLGSYDKLFTNDATKCTPGRTLSFSEDRDATILWCL